MAECDGFENAENNNRCSKGSCFDSSGGGSGCEDEDFKSLRYENKWGISVTYDSECYAREQDNIEDIDSDW